VSEVLKISEEELTEIAFQNSIKFFLGK